MRFVFIDPDFEKIVNVDYEDDANEAVAAFRSSVWRQGYNSEKRMRQYDDWAVYSENSNKALDYLGQVKDYEN